MALFLTALGLAMILEGLPYFSIPGQMKALTEKIHETDDSLLRLFGLVLMLFGLLVIYIGKKIFS